MTAFFGIILLIGAAYLLIVTVGGLGDALSFDVEIPGFGDIGGAGDAAGIGLNVIAGFMVAFGAVGVTGSLAGWNIGVVLVVATAIGVVVGRILARFVRFIYAQQSAPVASNQTLVGAIARVTINTPAGKLGEAIIEEGEIVKHTVREVSGLALQRGDRVQVVSIEGRVLNVKKKRDDFNHDAPQSITDLFDDDK